MGKFMNIALIFNIFVIGATNGVFTLNYTFSDFENNATNETFTLAEHFLTVPTLATSKISLNLGLSSQRILLNVNISESCLNALNLYSNGIKTGESWAIQMSDASAEIPSGLVSGTKMDFGSFDQCLQVATQTFRGQYCMLEYRTELASSMRDLTPHGNTYLEAHGCPPEWMLPVLVEKWNCLKTAGLWLGTCLPSACSEENVQTIYSPISESWMSTIEVVDCQSEDKFKKWPAFTFISKYLLILLFTICIIGTVLDYIDRNHGPEGNIVTQKGSTVTLLQHFSVLTHTKNLFKVEKSDRNPLSCFNGIRVLMTAGVANNHCAMYPERWREMKYYEFYTFTHKFNWMSITVENGFMGLEYFFFISGFLTLLGIKPKLKKANGKIDIVEFILQKYVRMMPSFLFVLLLYYVVPTLGNGPLWNSVWDTELDKCQQHGWMNLLFVHNFLSVEDMCIVHSWFLGSLIQTQIVGLFLVMLVYKRPKLGVIVGTGLIIVCTLNDYRIAFSNNYPMMAFAKMDSFDVLQDYSEKVYLKPFNHFASTVLGMMLYWYIDTHRNKTFSKKFQMCAWTFTFIVQLLLLYAIYFPITDLRITSAYHAGKNILWTLTVSWIIYACVTGNAHLLNRFLSWDIFIVLNRISYNVYLIHPLVLLYGTATTRERYVVGKVENILEVTGLLMIAMILSTIAYVTVEAPFNAIYNSFIRRKKSRPPADKKGK